MIIIAFFKQHYNNQSLLRIDSHEKLPKAVLKSIRCLILNLTEERMVTSYG